MSLPASSPATSTAPKMMSSRLATMKFMQRGSAASTPLSTPIHAHKRRRIETPNLSVQSTPTSVQTPGPSQTQRKAVGEAEEGGDERLGWVRDDVFETEWTLVTSGSATARTPKSGNMSANTRHEEDSNEDGSDPDMDDIWGNSTTNGNSTNRMTFGNYNKRTRKTVQTQEPDTQGMSSTRTPRYQNDFLDSNDEASDQGSNIDSDGSEEYSQALTNQTPNLNNGNSSRHQRSNPASRKTFTNTATHDQLDNIDIQNTMSSISKGTSRQRSQQHASKARNESQRKGMDAKKPRGGGVGGRSRNESWRVKKK